MYRCYGGEALPYGSKRGARGGTPRGHATDRRRHRHRKRSGRSRLQRWVKHTVARHLSTHQVMAIEPDETLHGLFDLSTGSIETASECDSSDPAAEVLMVDGPHSPPSFRRDNGGDGGGDLSRVHEEYRPEPLSLQQREELRRCNMDALHTPIIGDTPEA